MYSVREIKDFIRHEWGWDVEESSLFGDTTLFEAVWKLEWYGTGACFGYPSVSELRRSMPTDFATRELCCALWAGLHPEDKNGDSSTSSPSYWDLLPYSKTFTIDNSNSPFWAQLYSILGDDLFWDLVHSILPALDDLYEQSKNQEYMYLKIGGWYIGKVRAPFCRGWAETYHKYLQYRFHTILPRDKLKGHWDSEIVDRWFPTRHFWVEIWPFAFPEIRFKIDVQNKGTNFFDIWREELDFIFVNYWGAPINLME